MDGEVDRNQTATATSTFEIKNGDPRPSPVVRGNHRGGVVSTSSSDDHVVWSRRARSTTTWRARASRVVS